MSHNLTVISSVKQGTGEITATNEKCISDVRLPVRKPKLPAKLYEMLYGSQQTLKK